MLGCRALTIALLFLLAAPSLSAPRMRICTSRGMVTGTYKVFFGGGELFYAGLVDPDDPSSRFKPSKALRDVEWWMYKINDCSRCTLDKLGNT